MVNPDGYEYSRLSNDTRMWRKNRNTTVWCNDPGVWGRSIGVDLNRNFPTFSKIGDTIHTITENDLRDNLDCSETSDGNTHAISEPETKTVHEYIRKIKANSGVIAAIDVHSFSEVFLMPDNLDKFGFGAEKEVMMEIGEAMAKAISKVDRNSD